MQKTKFWLSWLVVTSLLFNNVAFAVITIDGVNDRISIGGSTGTTGQILQIDGSGNASYGSVTGANISNSEITGDKMDITMTSTERDALTPAEGMMIYNTTTGQVEVYTSSTWTSADADTTYSAGSGLSLTGSTFSADLGLAGLNDVGTISYGNGKILIADADSYEEQSITGDLTLSETGSLTINSEAVGTTEIENGSITITDLATALVLDEDDLLSDSATALATQQSIKAYVDAQADNDTTYTGSGGITLTGTEFSLTNDFGASIDTGEITDGTIAFGDLATALVLDEDNLLSDSATALATQQSIKAYVDAQTDNDTTYTAGDGMTLTGTTFSADLGTAITSSEITDGEIVLADLSADAYETTTIDSATDGDDLVTEQAVEDFLSNGGYLTSGSFTYNLADVDDTQADTNGMVLVWNNSQSKYNQVSLSGDVTVNETGVTDIATGAVTPDELNIDNADPAGNIGSPAAGMLAYDTTDSELQRYSGSAWISVGGDDLGNHTATDDVALGAFKLVNADGEDGIAVASGGDVTIDGDVTISGGGSATYDLAVTGTIHATSTVTSSDLAFKEDVSTLSNPIETLVALRGVQWTWKDEYAARAGVESDRTHYGVIAQEIEQILPELVVTDDQGYKAVNYNELAGLFIEVNKAQQSEIEALQARINKLETLLLNVAAAQ